MAKLNPGLPWNKDTFHQQIGFKFKEETSEVPQLEHSFVWCWNVGTSEKFWNVVLEKDGVDRLGRSCEKWSIAESQKREKYSTYNKKEEGYLDWSHLACDRPTKIYYWREDRGKVRCNEKTRKKTKAATGKSQGRDRVLEIERGCTRSYCVENSVWKNLWTCRKTDYGMLWCACSCMICIRAKFYIYNSSVSLDIGFNLTTKGNILTAIILSYQLTQKCYYYSS